jgi:hypothetical protein
MVEAPLRLVPEICDFEKTGMGGVEIVIENDAQRVESHDLEFLDAIHGVCVMCFEDGAARS